MPSLKTSDTDTSEAIRLRVFTPYNRNETPFDLVIDTNGWSIMQGADVLELHSYIIDKQRGVLSQMAPPVLDETHSFVNVVQSAGSR